MGSKCCKFGIPQKELSLDNAEEQDIAEFDPRSPGPQRTPIGNKPDPAKFDPRSPGIRRIPKATASSKMQGKGDHRSSSQDSGEIPELKEHKDEGTN